jgi:hypothetical protein
LLFKFELPEASVVSAQQSCLLTNFGFQDTISEELQEYKLYLLYPDGFSVTREHKLVEAKIAFGFYASREDGVIFFRTQESIGPGFLMNTSISKADNSNLAKGL